MKTYFRRLFIFLLAATGLAMSTSAVEVTFRIDSSQSRSAAITTAERNLAQILTEINRAQKADAQISMRNFKMDDFAKKSLARLWAVAPFYCDDEEVVERCWVFKDGSLMVSHIPLILQPKDEKLKLGTYQEAVVEFDRSGNVTDFRFSLGAQTGLSMEHVGVEDIENNHIIIQQVERFRTAYNQMDLATIEQMFSDDALIITGTVIKTKALTDSERSSFKVVYNRQNKEQYIKNLQKCFARNKWIDVKFDLLDDKPITRSTIDPTRYGVRLRQTWKSTNYSDEGYLFLLFELPKQGDPIIHVRTWQPEFAGDAKARVHQEPDDDISTLGGFGL